MKRGVKQGFALAPLLWAINSTYLAHLIGPLTDYDWMLRCMTLYADDTHVIWDVQHVSDLLFMRKCVQAIFHVSQMHGMKVNPHKSTFISGIIRKVGRQWLHAHQSHRAGSNGTPSDLLKIPQSSMLKYLGVIISYRRCADQTSSARLQNASVTRQSLVKVLHASHFLYCVSDLSSTWLVFGLRLCMDLLLLV